jgi:hypothetical protein
MNESLGACPVCSSELIVSQYTCTGCGIELKGSFRRCDLCNLPNDLLHFVRVFLKSQGNIKEVERVLGLSYPTVKSRLARVNQALALGDFAQYMETQDRLGLLKRFKEGEIPLDDVLKLL